MTAQFTICIAHKDAPENDEALRVALDCIVANTVNQYALLVDTTTPEDPYAVYNRLAKQARTPYIVFSNSDVFFAPGWDVPLLEAAAPNTIVTGVLVECGAMGVNPRNVHHDFGMTPATFDRAAFEAYPVPLPDCEGWYMPCLMPRDLFVAMGGFDLSRGTFMKQPLDIYFWDDWQAAGYKLARVLSISYHLQNWSNPVEQTKPVRLG